MSKEWQAFWKAEGMIPPKQASTLDDHMLIRGLKELVAGMPIPPTYVFFKIDAEDIDEASSKARAEQPERELRNFVQIYGLVTGRYVTLTGPTLSQIDESHPLGKPFALMELTTEEVPREDEIEGSTTLLKRTIDKFNSIKGVFMERHKGFLRNAIDYYYRALGDSTLEEELIDLMVSIESLFSTDIAELRYRTSLRMAHLVSLASGAELPEIFHDVYNLYDKRSKILHGMEDVELSCDEMGKLKKYVLHSLKCVIDLDLTKGEIIHLLDDAIIGEPARRKLSELVAKALSDHEQ